MTRTLIIALALGASMAQAPADDSRPASSNVLNAQYPRVHADNRLTFRLTAPNAQKVQLQPGGADNGLGKGPVDMTRDEKGVWSITLPSAVPGFHYYWFVVDGLNVNDPGSETYFGWGRQTSGIEVPEPGADYYDTRNVPHGQVRLRLYESKVTGAWRQAYVYTPPDYDAEHQDPLPRPLSSARRGRERDELDQAGPRAPHPRQPDRRRQGEAHDRGHGHWLRDQARRDAGAGRDRHAPDPQRVRGRRHQRSDPDDRRQLPHACRSGQSRHGWAVDGRRADAADHVEEPRTRSPGSARSAPRCATSTSRRP